MGNCEIRARMGEEREGITAKMIFEIISYKKAGIFKQEQEDGFG